MKSVNMEFRAPTAQAALAKFEDPNWTAKGERRAEVALDELETLWINTGTLCNIECVNCYIESSPSNDRLVYIKAAEVRDLLDEIAAHKLGTEEIAFTGGEPFMNPEIIEMLHDALSRGFNVLVLTNAMQPMRRPRVKQGLIELNQKFGDKLVLRVSLDHHTKILHESERGTQTWERALEGLDWLSENGFSLAIAGRTCWDESEEESRRGYAELIRAHSWPINWTNESRLMLLPEMDGSHDVPEITTACWDILAKQPSDMMCASSRMVVKRKGNDKPSIVPCTLLPYDQAFDMGSTLEESLKSNGGMFADGAVKLCHPHCAKFCVLGGGCCS